MIARLLILVLAAVAAHLMLGGPPARPTSPAGSSSPACEVYFSPPAPDQPGTVESAIVREIGRARSSILVQAYSFTSMGIADALVAARARGLAVAVIVDPTDEAPWNRAIPRLIEGDVAVSIDRAHAIAHNKIIIIDAGTPGVVVLGGSYNFTAAAGSRNAENLRITRRDPLGDAYAANWRRHRMHAVAAARHGKEVR